MALSPVGLCRSPEMDGVMGTREEAAQPCLWSPPSGPTSQGKAGFDSCPCFSPETCPKHCALNYAMQWNTEQCLPGKSLWSNTDQKKEPGAAPPSHCSEVLVLCWWWNSSPLAEVAFAGVSLMEPNIPPTYFSSGKGWGRVCWRIQVHTCYRGRWDTLALHFHVVDWKILFSTNQWEKSNATSF